MKKYLIALAALICFHTVFAQKDPQLVKRLNALMQATQDLDFEKIMDYTYPKVFTIAPKKKMPEALKNGLSTDEMIVRFDSLKIDSL